LKILGRGIASSLTLHRIYPRHKWHGILRIFINIHEIFEKRSILSKFKEDEDFNRRNTLGILRIKI